MMKELEESMEYVDQYHAQRAVVIEVLQRLGIPSLLIPGWEGDDLMYICTKLIDQTVVVTDDRDLIQLLAPNVMISRPMANELLTYDEWQQDHDDPNMRRFVIEKSIIGDGSDNIPKCCYGVGGKAAEEISRTMIESPFEWRSILSQHRLKKFRDFTSDESVKQFEINMELIDLQRVDMTEDNIVEKVTNELNSVSTPDFFKTLAILGEYEIESVDTSSLIGNLINIITRMKGMI